MRKIWLLILMLAGPVLLAQQPANTIFGKVTDGREGMSDVTVMVEDSDRTTFTDEEGKYRIQANPGEILRFSYQGMKTQRIMVEDVTRVLNPVLSFDVAELDEVVVVGSNRKTQKELAYEYNANENLIRTAYGILNAETAPGKIQFLKEEDINPITICILDLLRNQFPGVRVQGDCLGGGGNRAQFQGQVTNITANAASDAGSFQGFDDPEGGKVFIRGASSIFNQRSAIFDVDGQIFYTAPVWLDVRQIRRLAILNNFATTTMYGNVGAGGVIVVNTLTASPKPKKITDLARLRNNYLTEKVLSPQQVADNAPTYMRELRASGSDQQARSVFEKFAARYSSSPYFFLDAYTYFSEERNDQGFADSIIAERMRLFDGNPVLLKALAYTYQAQGRDERAHEQYKKVFELRPGYGQSYMDLAESYRDIGAYDKAAGIYQRYYYLVDEGYLMQDSTAFQPILEREYNNLLYLNRAAVVSADKRDELYVEQEIDFKGTRVVFEWNDGEAEFDLQFVNPERQYFNWEHSQSKYGDEIMMEKRIGFNTQEFLIDDSMAGTWQVNATYLGNKSLTPTYLKVTIYDNFGTRSQRKQVRVFKLKLKNVPQELFTLTKSVSVAMN